MKYCPVCKEPVLGRSNKIYCSPKCKSAQQYEERLVNEQFYYHVDKQLKNNRRLLKKYNQSGFTTLKREVLKQEGFNPRFFTHYWKNSSGEVYLFCYDFGFLAINKNGKKKYLIVEWQDYMNASV